MEWTDAVGSQARLSNLMVGRAVTHDCLEVSEWDTTGGAELEKKGQEKKGGKGEKGGSCWGLHHDSKASLKVWTLTRSLPPRHHSPPHLV